LVFYLNTVNNVYLLAFYYSYLETAPNCKVKGSDKNLFSQCHGYRRIRFRDIITTLKTLVVINIVEKYGTEIAKLLDHFLKSKFLFEMAFVRASGIYSIVIRNSCNLVF
jgi:hypothetical protein